MTDLIIRNYEQTQEELLVDYDKHSFFENWQESETWELSMTIRLNERNKVSFDLVAHESSIFYQGQEFIIKQLSDGGEGSSLYKTVVATHVYYSIAEGYQYDTVTGRRTMRQLLTHVFAAGNRGFSWDLVDPNNVIGSRDVENFGDDSYLGLINKLLSDFGAVVIPDNRRLTFYPAGSYGQATEQQIRYKHNTDDVRFDIDTLSLRTQIRGFGGTDDDDCEYFAPITYTSPESAKWGIRIQQPVRDERYQVAANMRECLIRELQDQPAITGIVTLKWTAEINKGDFVPFIYEPLNVNTYIQVVGYKKYPAVPNKPPEIILSNTKKTMTSILAKLIQRRLI
ncbi:phage tail protein [Enterococcus casseliflavus]|uniref:phage tail protein n=1 Tax=Enterococcus casseliflavus TaxID=37734 RepID=UPI001CA7DA3F|nr:phage tail protein [Enterococcus casseliflavus]MBZ0323613.1 phage tail protein [Enterococcus casseliflavus]